MFEPCQQGPIVRSSITAPIRPQKREGRHLIRQHPYKRSSIHEQLSVARAGLSRSSNGHASVVYPQERNGKDLQSVRPDLHQLMAQVAAGIIAPEAAASQVQRQVEDKATSQHETAADQLFHQLATSGSNFANGAESSTSTQAFQELEEAESSASWADASLPQQIIWGTGKAAGPLAISLQRSAQKGLISMAARVSLEVAGEVEKLLPEVQYNAAAQALVLLPKAPHKPQRLPGMVAIVSDSSVAETVTEEVRAAAAALGCYSYKLGGAAGGGLSNILPNLSALQSADVVIVIAGPEEEHGLVSVIAGSVESPVVAVPTSHLSASLPPGVTSVQRNNGLAAAIFAARLLRTASKFRTAAK